MTVKRKAEPYLYILPSIALVLLLFFYPLLQTIFLSFFKVTLGKTGAYVGSENYLTSIQSTRFQDSIMLTAKWTGLSVALCVIVGLGLALVFNEKFPGNRIVSTLTLIPWVMPSSIIALMWRWTLHPGFGILNYSLLSLGLINKPISFLTNLNIVLYSLVLVRVWRGAPFATFSFLSGLHAIPLDLYEAAGLDGAGAFQKFRYVTLPLLKPVIAMVVTLLTIWTFQLFEIIYVLTGGGPYGKTETIPIFLYLSIFSRHKIGLATASAIIVSLFMLVLTYIYFKEFARK